MKATDLSGFDKNIIVLSMLFVTFSVAADVVAYKIIPFGMAVESGATFIFPLTYVIGDIIAEVYNYKIARFIIIFNLFCELVFSSLIKIVIHLPSIDKLHINAAFIATLDSIPRFVLGGAIAVITEG